MARTRKRSVPHGELTEAARMLRLALAEFPATTARERAVARRVEGAVTTLETLAATDPDP